MPKTRRESSRRFRKARDDASIGSVQRTAEKAFELPPGSVRIVLPSGRKAREDGSVGSLRSRYASR